MNEFVNQNVSLEKCPALVLNADYRPLSYYPLNNDINVTKVLNIF